MWFIPEWAIGVAVIVIAIQLGRVVSKIFGASPRTLPASDGEVGELRQALDAMQTRVGELEERLDFTERLIAKQRDSDRLGPPPR